MPDDPSEVPDVTSTSLDRADLEEAADELGIEDIDDLDDQALFERVGVALGQLDQGQLQADPDDAGDDQPSSQADDGVGLQPRSFGLLGVEVELGGFRVRRRRGEKRPSLPGPPAWLRPGSPEHRPRERSS